MNGPASVTITGGEAAVAQACAALTAAGVRTQGLRVSHAFHSALMEPMLDAFTAVAETVRYGAPRVGVVSTVTGAAGDGGGGGERGVLAAAGAGAGAVCGGDADVGGAGLHGVCGSGADADVDRVGAGGGSGRSGGRGCRRCGGSRSRGRRCWRGWGRCMWAAWRWTGAGWMRRMRARRSPCPPIRSNASASGSTRSRGRSDGGASRETCGAMARLALRVGVAGARRVFPHAPISTARRTWMPAAGSSWLTKAAWARRLADLIAFRGGSCTVVVKGESFRSTDAPHRFVVNPQRREDFDLLVGAACGSNQRPCRGVIHLWSLDDPLSRRPDGRRDRHDSGTRLRQRAVHRAGAGVRGLAGGPESHAGHPRCSGRRGSVITFRRARSRHAVGAWQGGRARTSRSSGARASISIRPSQTPICGRLYETVATGENDENQIALRGGQSFALRLVRSPAADAARAAAGDAFQSAAPTAHIWSPAG